MGAALASLLAAGGAHAYLVQGQVRLAQLQQELVTAQAQQHDLEVQVAQLESPSQVVSQGEQQGLTIPSQVTDLPLVPAPGSLSASSTSSSAAGR